MESLPMDPTPHVMHKEPMYHVDENGSLTIKGRKFTFVAQDMALVKDEDVRGALNLIAAAPELLEALKRLYEEWQGDYNSPANQQAREAITKAEGVRR